MWAKAMASPATAFKPPVDHCHWPPPSHATAIDVVMTPLVIDLDGDGLPEVVSAAAKQRPGAPGRHPQQGLLYDSRCRGEPAGFPSWRPTEIWTEITSRGSPRSASNGVAMAAMVVV